jgi:hypothetical protein
MTDDLVRAPRVNTKALGGRRPETSVIVRRRCGGQRSAGQFVRARAKMHEDA